jgi:hypothetical protein
MNTPNESVGSILIRARTGYGFFPLEGVLVTVISEEGASSTVVATGYTNDSGLSPEFVLPASVREGSTDLEPLARKFTVEAEKPGYQSVILHGIRVYPQVLTVQNVNLAPLPEKTGLEPTPYDLEMVREETVSLP